MYEKTNPFPVYHGKHEESKRRADTEVTGTQKGKQNPESEDGVDQREGDAGPFQGMLRA